MGYRSQVRSLIYGDPDKMQALISAHILAGGKIFDSWLGGSLTRHKATRYVRDQEASREARQYLTKTLDIEILNLTGDYWKWDPHYEDVAAWHALLVEAANTFGLSYEFVRIGEEPSDIEIESHVADGGEQYLYTVSSIQFDAPDDMKRVGLTG